jgi:hypothetical protein
MYRSIFHLFYPNSPYSNGGLIGGGPPMDTRVADLSWNWMEEARQVPRQQAVFYRLNIDKRQVL